MYKEASLLDFLASQMDENNLMHQCAWCNDILDLQTDEFFWPDEIGPKRNLDAKDVLRVSHTICPICKSKLDAEKEELKRMMLEESNV